MLFLLTAVDEPRTACGNSPLAAYYFGHHPANRFELSKGRDLDVDPAPDSGPINFLAYPIMEVNGETIKVPRHTPPSDVQNCADGVK